MKDNLKMIYLMEKEERLLRNKDYMKVNLLME